jgi:hypothetical protein
MEPVTMTTHTPTRAFSPARQSLTPDALLLHRGQLHRVDSAQIPAHATGGAAGHCRTPAPGTSTTTATACTQDCNQGRTCTCAFGTCDEGCTGWDGMTAKATPQPLVDDTPHTTRSAPAWPLLLALSTATLAWAGWLLRTFVF